MILLKGRSMEHTFEGVFTLKDYIKLCRRLNRKRAAVTHIIGITVLTGILFFPDPIDQIGRIIANPFLLVWVLLPIFVYIAASFVIDFLNSLTYRKAYKSDKLAAKVRHYKITEGMISVVTENTNLSITKDEVRKILLEHDRTYVFYSAVSAITIKKSYFEDGQKYEQVKQFILMHYK